MPSQEVIKGEKEAMSNNPSGCCWCKHFSKHYSERKLRKHKV